MGHIAWGFPDNWSLYLPFGESLSDGNLLELAFWTQLHQSEDWWHFLSVQWVTVTMEFQVNRNDITVINH